MNFNHGCNTCEVHCVTVFIRLKLDNYSTAVESLSNIASGEKFKNNYLTAKLILALL